MTAIATSVTNLSVKRGPFVTDSFIVANAAVIASTDIFIGLSSGGYAGALSTGTYNAWAGLREPNGLQPVPITGDTTATPPPEVVVVAESVMLINVAVTGVTAVTDLGAAVYASDSKSLTLTKGSNVACGWVKRFRSTGFADVRLASKHELEIKTVQA